MKRTLLWITGLTLLLSGVATTRHAVAQDKGKDITGNWQGTLQAGRGLRTLIRISKDDGKLKAVLYSIDQGGQPIPATAVSLQGTSFNFEIKPLDLTYTGTLNPEGNAIAGSATQNGQAHVLNLEHVTAENAWPIPAPPKSMDPNATPKFDVVTIKPSKPDQQGKGFGFRGRQMRTINTNLNDLITFAYGLHVKQIMGAPAWFATDHFDLDGVPDVEGQPNAKQMKMLVQSALADRFKLTFHHEQKELSVYALSVSKSGAKLTETTHKPNDPGAFFFRKLGALTVANFTMKDFCDGMQAAVMDKPVVDHTGLTARYDFTLNWTPDESQFEAMGGYRPPPTEDPNAPPALSTAMQEQLGLKFESTRALADVFVIDHVEKPSAN
ncbi:MAG: TIGR03435 family protein [Edaphobacter sp.]